MPSGWRQVAVQLRIGERFDANLVADVEPVRRRLLVAGEAVDHVELIVDAESVFRT